MKHSRVAYPPGQLYAKEFNFAVAGAAILESEFTVPQGRGDVQAFSVDCGSAGATVNEMMKANISISPNGVSALEESSLKKYSDLDSNREQSIVYPQCIAAGSSINYKIDNTGNANALDLSIILYFYYPIQEMDVKEHAPSC